MRLIIAAILGGIVMFAWAGFSHMVLGNSEASGLPPASEAAVIANLKTNVTAEGFYILPGMDMTKTPSAEEMAAWTAKYQAGPTAILVYNPTGGEGLTPKLMGTELASNIAAALLVGIILSFASVGFVRGTIISTLVGLSGWMAIEVSYWNWFRFPTNFVRGELIDQTVGFFLMGLILAFFLRRRG